MKADRAYMRTADCPATCGHGRCYRCLRRWCQVEFNYHSTKYDETHGCFPLCEACWLSLTPADRLPFYSALVCEWRRLTPDLYSLDEFNRDWSLIEGAVLEGR
jgi:hypothetical protein